MERIWYETYGAVRPYIQVSKLAAEPVRPYSQVPTHAADPVRFYRHRQVPTHAADPVRFYRHRQVPTHAGDIRRSIQVLTLPAEDLRPYIQVSKLAAEPVRLYSQVPTHAADPVRFYRHRQVPTHAEDIRRSIQVPTLPAEDLRPYSQVPTLAITLAAEDIQPSIQVPTLPAEDLRPSIQIPTLAAEAMRAKHSPEEWIQICIKLWLLENPESIFQFGPILSERVNAEDIRRSIQVLTDVAEAIPIPPSIQETFGTISSELDKMNKKETTEKYKRMKVLASGCFGEVWLVKNNVTKEHFAMKCIERGKKFDKYMAREIIIQKSLCHPNVIQFIEVVLDSSYLGIVMEYAEGGDLDGKIFQSTEKRLDENMARYYFWQLISGVSYLHSKDISHRDLKPGNILLDGSDPSCLKICDFGFSKSGQLHSKPKSAVGTPEYMAPEVGAREYNGKSADSWSCGAILYHMLVGKHLKDKGKTSNETNACLVSLPGFLSPNSKDLLARMLVVDPVKRITIGDVKKHQWFKMNLKEELPEATQVTKNPRLSLQSDEEIKKIVEEAESVEEEDGI